MLEFFRQIVNSKWFCAVFGAIVVFVMIAPELFNGIKNHREEDEEDA